MEQKKVVKGKVLVGQVVATRPKTLIVRVRRLYRIPKYGILKIRYKKMHVHVENESVKLGETVSIVSSRAYSALKRWVLLSEAESKIVN
ncbi:30S ribosomal protein S17 [Mycoplasma ovis str. Michigan]|uniref:30S ribosomal protein S17 n=1 Tax=Mycoplasma ovis str. Michigan TaxID=1415773 RepID=A0ABM5P0W9_9MOLU|nr:uS17 family ribosomal protein [Mycoplasma ovis]AHC39974.1 30S ribosomal protein S17 [Mycoplasma ovis str. Michigan]